MKANKLETKKAERVSLTRDPETTKKTDTEEKCNRRAKEENKFQ